MDKIKVTVRLRPFNNLEIESNPQKSSIININDDNNQVTITNGFVHSKNNKNKN
jgi:hypothetical protein